METPLCLLSTLSALTRNLGWNLEAPGNLGFWGLQLPKARLCESPTEGNPYLSGDHPPAPFAILHPGEDECLKATPGLRPSNFIFLLNMKYYLRGDEDFQLEVLESALGFFRFRQMLALPCSGPHCTDSFQIISASRPAACLPRGELPPPCQVPLRFCGKQTR